MPPTDPRDAQIADVYCKYCKEALAKIAELQPELQESQRLITILEAENRRLRQLLERAKGYVKYAALKYQQDSDRERAAIVDYEIEKALAAAKK